MPVTVSSRSTGASSGPCRTVGYTADKSTIKSVKIVGEVMGNYHPHGDSALYEGLVAMGQEWSLRYPLITPQGNFGSIDGDPPAAMRYTEAKMSQLGAYLLRDVKKDTVDWVPTFDPNRLEPTVLPAGVPNLLMNGSEGIAVGMATRIPPHNLREADHGHQEARGESGN